MKKKKTKWVGKVDYENGFFRSGVVKNNIPKHDVIIIQFKKEIKKNKKIFIDKDDWCLALDEAMVVCFLILKSILYYVFNLKKDIRLLEYEDELKTLKIKKVKS